MSKKHYIDTAFEIKDMSDSGVFSGLGSVFGNIDFGNDIVAPGAFTAGLETMRAKGRMPAMLWQHRQGEPIGAYKSMTETKDGLVVEGQLALKTQRGAEAYELMKMGAVSGLSIGGWTTADSYDSKNDIRTITQFELWEVSVVTFPMNDEARIAAVKSIQEIGDLSGAEAYLREVGAISRSEAKAIVSRIHAIARREVGSDDSEELKSIHALLEKRRSLIAS
ncbi:TPA: HK97 family phage prohead protease [Burkholderia vietnamiensis]|nr:HK97 family phage prohead protease [Burkholderia vietnamiensis]HDR9230494.1 HK97 family phage prohead protease [Burkholderia vietnamiensis]